MTPTVLVVTTVHWPDDTRIRERLIRTLGEAFAVRYASKSPGPSDSSGLKWIELKGGRLRRNVHAFWLSLFGAWDVLSLHDPETLLAGVFASVVRRKPVVFDLHENLPATAMTRGWVPESSRFILAALMRRLLLVAEKLLVVTLAEGGYQHLFKSEHVVFPNYPQTDGYPDPASSGNGEVSYLGDVTRERGVDVAARACSNLGVPIVFVGRVSPDVQAKIQERPRHLSQSQFTGLMPNPEALERIRESSVAISPLLDLPNYRDSLPTKILEYLALGVPVVASDLPGTRDLVEGLAGVVLVPAGEPGQLASGISQMMDPSMKALAVGQASLIREKFSWPQANVLDFYRSLV